MKKVYVSQATLRGDIPITILEEDIGIGGMDEETARDIHSRERISTINPQGESRITSFSCQSPDTLRGNQHHKSFYERYGVKSYRELKGE